MRRARAPVMIPTKQAAARDLQVHESTTEIPSVITLYSSLKALT